MKSLIDTYGYCIIPENTILFRGYNDNFYHNYMFFGTEYLVAMAYSQNNIQIWKTTKEIQILFLIEYITNGSWSISTIPKLYNSLFPEEIKLGVTDLNIKQDRIKMNKFTNRLFNDYYISGFLTSHDGREEIEVCLFNKDANLKQLTLINTSDNNTSYFKDSLEKIKIFPTESFYKHTKEKINGQNSYSPDEEETYEAYRQKRDSLIRNEANNDEKEMIKQKHLLYNLRTHLKI